MARCLRLVLAASVTGATLRAQEYREAPRPLSIEVAALFASIQGGASETQGGGPGIDAQARWNREHWSLGGGIQLSGHQILNDGTGSRRWIYTTAFIEPRLLLVRRRLPGQPVSQVWIAARAGYVHRAIHGPAASSGPGLFAGAGLGVSWIMTDQLQAQAGGMIGRVSFGNVTTGGASRPGTAEGGTYLTLKAGLALLLP